MVAKIWGWRVEWKVGRRLLRHNVSSEVMKMLAHIWMVVR